MNADENATRNLVLFALLVNGLAWLGPLLGGNPSEPGPSVFVWGSAPLVATLLMKVLLRDETALGLTPKLWAKNNGRYYLLSILLYPLAIGTVLLLGLLLKMVSIKSMPPAEFAAAVAPLVLTYFVFAFFEEVGWRGYLAPAVDKVNSGLLGHAIVGVIWSSWHLPYFRELWAHTNEGLTTLLPRFVLGAIVAAVVYGEIRRRTGAVWPAVLMHWIGNVLANGLLTTIVVLVPGRAWLSSFGMEGALMLLLFAAVGGLLYQSRRQNENFSSAAIAEQTV